MAKRANVTYFGTIHLRRRQFVGGGVKNWSNLMTDSTKKLPKWGRGGVKNSGKLPTLFMDGPLFRN